jgi:hypothetical protein
MQPTANNKRERESEKYISANNKARHGVGVGPLSDMADSHTTGLFGRPLPPCHNKFPRSWGDDDIARPISFATQT